MNSPLPDPFPVHEQGEPCPVVDLLVNHFGEKYGGYLLWNFTCFPCDDRVAYEQARAFVAADRVGLFSEYLQSESDKQDEEFWRMGLSYISEELGEAWWTSHPSNRYVA